MYALATSLRGFRSTTLRVRVVEQRDGYAWVVTADLLDAGTPLTLDAAQLEPLAHTIDTGAVRHVSGLVAVGA